MRLFLAPALLCLCPIGQLAAEKPPARPKLIRPGRVKPVQAKDAKSIAEGETGGIAVSCRRIPLNGSTGGWEVDLRMPREDRGWRCIVDCDTHQVHTKTRIPNPKPSSRSR